MALNKYIAIGRLTKDPDVRYAGETEIASYSLAVDGYKKGDVNYIPCKAFGKQADFASRFLQKGTKVAICGRLQSGSYEKKDGTRIFTLDVIVEEYTFCEKRNPDAPKKPDDGFVQVKEEVSGFVPVGEGDDLPFV
jgi:single-strand DNA-binding protein